MVSCPCDLSAWRKHMLKYEFTKVGPFSLLFTLPVKSLSPINLASGVPPSIRVRMVVGTKDPVAPAELTREYVDALRKQGSDVAVTMADGLGHEILLEPVVFAELKSLVEVIDQKTTR
jgi:predicted esterase